MIEADDLAMLATSFEAAMTPPESAVLEPATVDAALFDLGWGDVLEMAPMQGAAAAFAVMGRTGAVAGLLDDVVAHALGLPIATDTCIVMPAAHASAPAGVISGRVLRVDGIVSARVDTAAIAVIPVVDGGAVRYVAVDATLQMTRVVITQRQIVRRHRIDAARRTHDWTETANTSHQLIHRLELGKGGRAGVAVSPI